MLGPDNSNISGPLFLTALKTLGSVISMIVHFRVAFSTRIISCMLCFACAMYSMPREDKACASVCTCDRMALLEKSEHVKYF